MKRILSILLLAFMTLPLSLGAAEAKSRTRKAKPAKAPKVVTVDAQSAVARDAESAEEREREGKSKLRRALRVAKERKQRSQDEGGTVVSKPAPIQPGPPVEMELKKAGSRKFDARKLARTKPVPRERPELEPPVHIPGTIGGLFPQENATQAFPRVPLAAAPAPTITFEGLDREFWGAGSPPDTTGDVGPTYYIQAVNTSVGIFRKSDGFMETAFTFDTLMSQGNFGNLCDTDNFGDPVVLYDTFEDRWILTNFAFLTDGGGNPLTPAFQCFAVSMNGDPLTGGWNFYSIQINDFLNDYEKLAIWPDGIYMSANMFGFGPGGTFSGVRVWAFNKAQMYAGSPTVKVVQFNLGSGDFAVMPSNARLQTGTPPAGRPNLFISSWNFTNALTVYKFHADWNSVSLSTFTGPDTPIAATSWPNAAVGNAPQSGTATLLDVLQIRAMVQNQYTNFGGVESLWIPHTVRRGNTTGFAAPRWYQVDVTGGTVAPNIPQAATWDPDAANVMHRFMPSLAVDRVGNMALAYSTSSATTFPSIAYAGRLAADPINTLSQTEQILFTGTASQTTSTRWGDYSSAMLDPDGCRFWITNEYANPVAQTFDKRWKTKVGSFSYPSCTPVGAGGTVTGTVTATVGGAPISGATINFGARTTTTNGSGVYSFSSIPAGTYPTISASAPGYVTVTASNIVVTDGGTTTQDFSLAAAPQSACLTDTTQADFLTGVSTNLDLASSPGNATLVNVALNQQNTAGTTTGTGFGTPAWTGQTFIPSVTGQLVQAEIQLFCNGCGATPPNLTLSVRNTAAGLPTGADLSSVTIPGSAFASGATTSFMATFGAPATITSGTQYALILRPVSVPAGSGYFWIRSSPSTYANGARVLSADSGGTWSTDTTRDYNFKVVIQGPYAPPSGNLVSSNKDSNPAVGLTPIWSTLSWNGTTPANTTLQFQVAGSNNPGGPFNFVGPDGTAGTFFTTSPAQLSPQFYNLRFLEYKAYLATADNAVTPTLHDATICFNDVDCSGTVATITPTPAQVCASSTGNTASGPAGMTAYSWGIANGTITSATNTQSITYTAGASGSVTLSLTVTAPNGCIVSGNTPVTINANPAQPTVTPGGPTSFCPGGSVTLTSSAATTYQWYDGLSLLGGETNQTYIATASGNYNVVVTTNNCPSVPSASTAVTVYPTPATPTITPGGPTTFCTGGSVTLTSSAASGYQWYDGVTLLPGETNQAYVATASGNYNVVITDGNGCPSAPSASTSVTVNSTPQPTVTPGGPTTFCTGGSVTLTSSAGTSYQWYDGLSLLGGETNQTYVATTSGNYNVVVTTNSCPSVPSASTAVTVNPIPATPTITPGGPTTFCAGGSVTLQSSSATGNQWYNGVTLLAGETNQNYVATASGNYNVVVTTSGCSSAPSESTSVTVNSTPQPTVTPGGPTTFCTGGSVTLTSSAGTSYQWYNGLSLLGGETNQTYVATASGNYNVIVTTNSCPSVPSASTSVTVNPIPATPTITPGGPTTFCAGGSVLLTSSSGSGNQWYLNGNPIGGATNSTYSATATGSYTVVVTTSGCSSPASAATNVTVNPIPATPTISGGPTSFCTGGSVLLSSSSASGNQWFLNGNPIGGATSQTFNATVAGDYTVTVTTSGCTSAPSAATTVTINPNPNATITAPANVNTGSTGNNASVANAGVGATYAWSITNGSITAGNNTPSITFTAGAVGPLSLNVTVTTAANCSDSKSANVNVTLPSVTVTSVTPNNGSSLGGTNVTIGGSGFNSGAAVTFGGSAATNVVVVNSGQITAKTPAHAAGAVNVTVTNTNTSTNTLNNGYTYNQQNFDPNGDNVIDPSDIFYLVSYLFLGGPAPAGTAGPVLSGDANGDGVVDPADIFYLVLYLFGGGPAPHLTGGVTTMSIGQPISGALSLGQPVRRDGRWFVPVNVSMDPSSATPQAFSVRVRFSGKTSDAVMHRGDGLAPIFEISRRTADSVSYLVAFNESAPFVLGASRSATIAEIEVTAAAAMRLEVDAALTMFVGGDGAQKATVANGGLRVRGTAIGAAPTREQHPNDQK